MTQETLPDVAAPEGDEATDEPRPTTRSRVKHAITAKPWLSAVVVLVIASAATAAVVFTGGDDDSASSATTTTRLTAVSTGTVRATVSVSGTISVADSTDVNFPASAEVTSVRVAQGEKVTKGQVLGTIDSLTLKSALAQAKADLADARSTLASAQDDGDTTDAQLAADEDAVTSAKRSVTEAKDDLADATLRSPITGTVAEVNVNKGEESSGSSSSTTGDQSTSPTSSTSNSSDAAFVVIGMKKWTVSADLDDTEIGLVSKGDQAQITTDNVTGTVFGTVSSVSVLSSGGSSSTTGGTTSDSSSTASYPVTIAVTGSPSGLHDGASATVGIVYKQATNVLTVPTTAVHSDGSTSYVYVSKNDEKTKQTVTTGLASGGTTQIKSGLTTSDKVYVETVTGVPSTSGNQQNRQQNGGQFPGGGNFPAGGIPGGNLPAGGQGGNR